MEESKNEDSRINTPDYFLKKYYKYFTGEMKVVGKRTVITFSRIEPKENEDNVFDITVSHFSEEAARIHMQGADFGVLDDAYELVFNTEPIERNE